MKTYNKLVRDNIPEIILLSGSVPITHVADDTEYWNKLKEKLQEEVTELVEGTNINEELADILEVIQAICAFKGINATDLEETRRKKAETRGAFQKRIVLEQTS